MITKYSAALLVFVGALSCVAMMGMTCPSWREADGESISLKAFLGAGCGGCRVIADVEPEDDDEDVPYEGEGEGEPSEDEEPPDEPADAPPLHVVNRQRVNPYNVIHVPRPYPDALHVPLRTDFFVMVGTEDESDAVEADSVFITLHPDGGDAFPILERNQTFPVGYSGELFFTNDNRYGPALAIYVDSQVALMPETRYRIRVRATSARGASIPADEQSWFFKTESATTTHALTFSLDLAREPDVRWHGEFFNSLAKPAFCTSSRSRLAHYDLIAQAQETYPHAWNLQRDAYLSGFEHQLNPFKNFPNIVREQETRRITEITRENGEVLLYVE
ncbi:MAG TPA: hypothetical protein ENN29_08465, partial [Candidatus Hydrogenedentes bacterium]|nr:hypothetical protein [Candidatus Hydrogenedentota bacterium]